MKVLMKTVFLFLLSIASSGVWAQTNTRVIGKLKGLEAGTVVYIHPVSSLSKKDSVVSKKGKFEFNLALDLRGERLEEQLKKFIK